MTIDYTLKRETKTKDHELEIEYNWIPYIPMRCYLNNGDPGYPAEGGYADIEKILLHGREVSHCLTDEEYQEIQEYVDTCHEE